MSAYLVFPPYPGRGVALHVTPTGMLGWIYFVTGRSVISRQRRVRVVVNDTLVVAPTESESTMDPLRHYRCARRAGDTLVLGNGDHDLTPGTASILTTYDGDLDQPAGTAPSRLGHAPMTTNEFAASVWARLARSGARAARRREQH